MSDPFDTDPIPQGPEYFERRGKKYVRDSRMKEFFHFLAYHEFKRSSVEFLQDLYGSWEKYGSLSTAQYDRIIEMVNKHGCELDAVIHAEGLENEEPQFQEGEDPNGYEGVYFGE